MIRNRLFPIAISAVMSLSACTNEAVADAFKSDGDEKLAGEWACELPPAYGDIDIALTYNLDGTGSSVMTFKNENLFGLTELEIHAGLLYRFDGTKITEKEVSSELTRFTRDGEEITGPERDETAKDMADIGAVHDLQVRFISDDEMILDEKTDNALCRRKGAEPNANSISIEGKWVCEKTVGTEFGKTRDEFQFNNDGSFTQQGEWKLGGPNPSGQSLPAFFLDISVTKGSYSTFGDKLCMQMESGTTSTRSANENEPVEQSVLNTYAGIFKSSLEQKNCERQITHASDTKLTYQGVSRNENIPAAVFECEKVE